MILNYKHELKLEIALELAKFERYLGISIDQFADDQQNARLYSSSEHIFRKPFLLTRSFVVPFCFAFEGCFWKWENAKGAKKQTNCLYGDTDFFYVFWCFDFDLMVREWFNVCHEWYSRYFSTPSNFWFTQDFSLVSSFNTDSC